MSGTGTGRHTPPARGGGPATGGLVFGGFMMVVEGTVGALQGIAGIARDDVRTSLGHYVFAFDLSTWGWIHLVIGTVVAVTGLGLLKSVPGARVTGTVLTALSVVANFLFLPYQPVWAAVNIALGVFVIWSLVTYRARPAG